MATGPLATLSRPAWLLPGDAMSAREEQPNESWR